jgi:hypothetical protein
MTNIYKTRVFQRWLSKTELSDTALLAAIDEVQSGLVEADLGQGLYKKRIALSGRGKSSGVRTLIASRHADRWFFLFGFEKNSRANITQAELQALQALAKEITQYSHEQLAVALSTGKLIELTRNT